MKSKKDLFGITINEREDGFLCITDLQQSFLIIKNNSNWGCKKINGILSTNDFQEDLYDLLKRDNIINEDFIIFNKNLKSYGIVKYLKNLKIWETVGKGITRKVWTHEKIFKLVTLNLFGKWILNNSPEWLENVKVDKYRYTSKREESKEKTVLDNLVEKTFIINNEIVFQYKLNEYKYDLKIDLDGTSFLIEYNEKQHRHSIQKSIDKDKLYFADINKFAYFIIPEGREEESFLDLKFIIKERLGVDRINTIQGYRFNLNHTKYTNLIIDRVLKGNSPFNATFIELNNIFNVEQTIQNLVGMGFAKTEKDILHIIQKCEL